MTKIILKKGRDESLKRFHPWVFSGAIQTIEGNPAEGDIVTVYSNKGQFLACGHYQIGTIAVRVLSFESPALLPDFWEQSLRKSLSAREAFGLCNNEQTNCYRLVHGEGDSLPGLIIDYYAGTAVMQAHSAGMFLSRTKITSALQSVYGRDLVAVYDKSSGTAPFKAGLELNDGYLYKA
ncbi:MAG: class I SAM-dependent rRNA methyltransferase, partial [Bacteroidales bacterium]|nr:class I SAM-dependent rRNA methyltransferase [Bacteroidales bacterium]